MPQCQSNEEGRKKAKEKKKKTKEKKKERKRKKKKRKERKKERKNEKKRKKIADLRNRLHTPCGSGQICDILHGRIIVHATPFGPKIFRPSNT
jgi:ATP-dependent 26S proteasome regulatory subunit